MSSREANGSANTLSGCTEMDGTQVDADAAEEKRCAVESGDEIENDDDEEEEGSDDTEEDDDTEEEGEEDDDEDEDGGSEESEDEAVSSGCTNGDTIKAPMSPNSRPTCYICLNEFEGQDVGSPDSCENIHYFCLECIEEWSKQINTCPVDRKSFAFILVRRDINGEVIMKVPVSKTSVVEIEAMDDDVTYCEICGRCDREDRLLLCDGCDFGYHCECLNPPIDEIPVDEWFCPECFDRLFGDDVRQETETYRRQSSSRRAIARTGAFEIVRNRILARRTTVEPTSSRSLSTGGTSSRSSSSANRRTATRKTTTRRKTTKRRKTRKATKRSTKGKKTKKRRKSKKRTRKSKFSNQRLPAAAAVRSRIASKLGICHKPKSPFGLPMMKSKSISVAEIRASAGIGGLSMFGYELELNNPRSYGEEFEFESSFGGVGLIARARSHISRSFGHKSIVSPEPLSSTDLLGEIMSSQEILHASNCDLTIARDGRIYLKSDAKSVQKCPDSNSHSSSSSSSASSNGSSAPNGNSNSSSSNNNGYLKQTSYSEQQSTNTSGGGGGASLPDSDISLVKPSPVVALLDEKPDFELYSDIESVGDNKEETEETTDKSKKSTAPSGNNKSNANCDKVRSGSDNNNCSGDMLLVDSAKEHDGNGLEKREDDPDQVPTKVEKKTEPSGSEPKTKRRPSIKDLFGGDSEEEEDVDDLKQLVAQQGSINVHYPIKMPIVLKTNFLTESNTKDSTGDDVPISKKWIPIYPEVDKNKNNSGPKWRAIGPTSAEKAGNRDNAGDSFREKPRESTQATARTKSAESGFKVEKKDLKGVIIERRIGLSRTVEMAAAAAAAASSGAKITEPPPSSLAHTTTEAGDQLKSSSTCDEATCEPKVRVCKHGRVINKKDKAKEASKEVVTRRRSPSVELVGIVKAKVVHSSDAPEDKFGSSGFRQTKKARLSAEPDDESDVNWKKLSSSSKMRNYRDGKYRDSELLYRERPPRTSESEKKSSSRDADKNSKRRSMDRDGHRSRYDGGERSSQKERPPATSGHRTKQHRSESNSDRNIKEDYHRSSGRRMFAESAEREVKSSRSHRNHSHHNHHHHHKRKREEEDRREKDKEAHSHRHHHRHHHSSKSSLEKPQLKKTAAVTSGSTISKPVEATISKPSSTYQTYPVINSVDSKKIYSDGDKIIINVSFKREEPPHALTQQDSRGAAKKDNLEAGKTESTADRKDSASISANKENVDILSPQSDDFSAAHGLPSDSNSITSPLSGDESGRSTTTNSKLSTSDNLKKVLSEEFNFLPRLMQIKDTSNSTDLQTRSPDHYLDDSFLPTPTQDESHSPINVAGTAAATTRHGKSSSSIRSTSSPDAKDDFYDPELPLQSPDRDSIKSPSKDNKSGYDDSVASPKDSSASKRDGSLSLTQAIPSTSSLSSTVAAATATLASLNSINLAQLIQIAQSFKSQNVQNNGGNSNGPNAKNSQKAQSGNKPAGEAKRDITDIVDMDVDSPSPFSSPFNSQPSNNHPSSSSLSNVKDIWDRIVKTASGRHLNSNNSAGGNNSNTDASKKHTVKFDIDEQPTSAVDMVIKDKYIKKLNRQERVVEEVKISLKPYYQKKKITKDEYKEILRKAVPKVCHSKTGEINPMKIQKMVEQYIKRYRYLRKKPTTN